MYAAIYEVEAKIHAAEDALQKANVSLAQGWGFKIHDCTFPPQIMLWDQQIKERKCSHCGFTTSFNRRQPEEPDEFIAVRL